MLHFFMWRNLFVQETTQIFCSGNIGDVGAVFELNAFAVVKSDNLAFPFI